jgi:hypothetical protein
VALVTPGRFTRTLARAERAVVGGIMRLIAVVAERRVKRGLEDPGRKKRRKEGVHVDLKDQF